jgi:AcrR family transcriptional regulator
MSTDTVGRLSARERLLAAANELFYAEGVNSVGIDRVIERAGVAKATLYSTFGSKEELIRAYLQARQDERNERITRELATRFDSPREKLYGVFDILGDSMAKPGFRGCAFINASVETQPGSAIEATSDAAREWVRSLFRDLAEQAGAANPDLMAHQLTMLYDGAVVTARMDRDPNAAATARTVAVSLVDAALDQPRARKSR